MINQLRIYDNDNIYPIDNYPINEIFILEKNNEYIMSLI
jgi:hypothetical protein